MEIKVYKTSDEAATAVAKLMGEELDRNPLLGLAGGSTPEAAYRKLNDFRSAWSNEVLWLGDERWTQLDAEDCNSRMIQRALSDEAAKRVLPVLGDFESPAETAEAYEKTLKNHYSGGKLGAVLLGLGDDGHTASLFPDTKALDETDRLYVENWVEKFDTWRLTATRPLLAEASRLIFLVCGAGKAQAVRQLVDPTADDVRIPARVVAEENSNVTVVLDEAAAGQVSL